MPSLKFFVYLFVTAGVTYLVRLITLVLVRGKIRSRFLLSFLYYVPYAVLSVMTVPAIFYATENPKSAAVGFLVALFAAYFEKSLLFVASAACLGVFLTELLFRLF